MINTKEITDSLGEIHIEIDNGNGSFTCMPKSTYDEQQAQAEHFTPMVTDVKKP